MLNSSGRITVWRADQVFVSLPRQCDECYKARLAATRNGRCKIWFWGRASRSEAKLEQEQLPEREFNQKVRADELLNLSGCRIVLTCHGAVTMAVQKYLPKAGRRCERVVYERVYS